MSGQGNRGIKEELNNDNMNNKTKHEMNVRETLCICWWKVFERCNRKEEKVSNICYICESSVVISQSSVHASDRLFYHWVWLEAHYILYSFSNRAFDWNLFVPETFLTKQLHAKVKEDICVKSLLNFSILCRLYLMRKVYSRQ